ncbi:MAG: tetratricopeptide repeat protein, partial [Micromonosporaceae bacterium]
SPVELGRRRERGLLALLLLEAGQVVSTDRLIELLFHGDPPGDPRKALQVHVSRLRRCLASAEAVRLVSHPAGYAIHCEPDAIDVHRFTGMVERARRGDDPVRRAQVLREALALWRGPALADLASKLRQRVCAGLDEARLGALELRVEADLVVGNRHDDLAAELADLTSRHPTRERLIAARMLALYRAGRQTDALEVYQETARRLVAEFGIDPGAELRELHTAILREDPGLAGPPPAPTSHTPSVKVRPAQLPADLSTFTGRGDELANLLEVHHGQHRTAVITAIDGMAGIGKTTLAVHAAHHLAPHYPDGQIFLDLHGFTEGVPPVEPADAVDRMLRSLGVPVDQASSNLHDRAALYRSVLADKRVLILLDNAETEVQVEPLLPAAPGCLVLVTSRRRLAGLDDVNPISLDLLPLPDAVALFTRIVGANRLVKEDPSSVAQVVELCGQLPLAIRIAAARLRTRPSWSLGDLVERLGDRRHRLAELQAGNRSVTAAVDLSYEHLTDDRRRLFRLLGLCPGPDIDARATAALAGTTPHHARRLLDDLLDVHLLQQRSPDRYRAHDLLRAHAAQTCAEEEPESAQRSALARLFDWYLHAVTSAMKLIRPDRQPQVPEVAAPAAPLPRLRDFDEAMAWLEAERHNLLATVQDAAARGFHNHAWKIPNVLYRYFHVRGYNDDWIAANQLALEATRTLGDLHGEAEMLNKLGLSYVQSGRFRDALAPLEGAIALHRQLGDRQGEALTASNLGIACWQSGRRTEAVDHFHEALAFLDDDSSSEARIILPRVLNNLGKAYLRLGRHAEALEHLQRGLELRRPIGDRFGIAATLANLGVLYARLGQYERALEHLGEALEIQRDLGHRDGQVDTHMGLGEVYARQRQHHRARQEYERALTLNRQIGHRVLEVEALNGLGEVCQAAGEPGDARSQHTAALAVAEHLGDHHERGRAHHGIGRSLLAEGDHLRARDQLDKALALFTELDAPEAEQVRASLTELDQGVPA